MDAECAALWKAYNQLIRQDGDMAYEEELIQGIKYLAEIYEAPSHTRYNDYGKYIRMYPLVVLLYISFIARVSKKRISFLKRIQEIKLRTRQPVGSQEPVVYSLFYLCNAIDVFNLLHPGYPSQKYCDGVGSHLKQIIKTYIDTGELFWSYESEFFIGEFVLCRPKLAKRPKAVCFNMSTKEAFPKFISNAPSGADQLSSQSQQKIAVHRTSRSSNFLILDLKSVVDF